MESKNPILSRYETKQQGAKAATYQVSTTGSGVPTTPSFDDIVTAGGAKLTLNDVIIKCMVMFGITIVFSFIGWQFAGTMPLVWILGTVAMLGLGIANSVMRRVNIGLVVAYAVVTGVVLGAVSNWYNTLAEASQYEGIVLQAVIGTMTAFGVMLILYTTKIVKVTSKFVRVMIGAMFAYLLIGIASFIGAIFGVGGGWGFYGVEGWGLLLCIAGVAIASFSLMLDFEAISQGIAMGAPERESWRMAFGLLVTLVWLYLEILRLLAIVSGRN